MGVSKELILLFREQSLALLSAVKWNEEHKCEQKSNIYSLSKMTGIDEATVERRLKYLKIRGDIYFVGATVVLSK